MNLWGLQISQKANQILDRLLLWSHRAEICLKFGWLRLTDLSWQQICIQVIKGAVWYVNFLNKTLPIQEVIYILKNESVNKSCSKLKKRYSLSFLSLLCSYIKILFVHYKIDNRFLWILLHQWKVRLPNYNGDNFLQSLLPHKISITDGGNSFCLFHPAVFPFHHKSKHKEERIRVMYHYLNMQQYLNQGDFLFSVDMQSKGSQIKFFQPTMNSFNSDQHFSRHIFNLNNLFTVFPRIVFVETILFLSWP